MMLIVEVIYDLQIIVGLLEKRLQQENNSGFISPYLRGQRDAYRSMIASLEERLSSEGRTRL